MRMLESLCGFNIQHQKSPEIHGAPSSFSTPLFSEMGSLMLRASQSSKNETTQIVSRCKSKGQADQKEAWHRCCVGHSIRPCHGFAKGRRVFHIIGLIEWKKSHATNTTIRHIQIPSANNLQDLEKLRSWPHRTNWAWIKQKSLVTVPIFWFSVEWSCWSNWWALITAFPPDLGTHSILTRHWLLIAVPNGVLAL